MKYEGVDHTCDFKLEQTSQGYFTGYFVCTFCGIRLSQAQWLDTIKSDSDQPGSLPEAA
jgi:hypothetical protein